MVDEMAKNTWDRVLGRIETKVNPRSFNTWFKPTHLVGEEGGALRVRVPNTWYVEWLQSNYRSVIEEALRELELPEVSVRFVPADRDALPDATQGDTAVAPGPAGEAAALNPRYRFETFVVSSCNQFAHAAALAVAEQPGGAYNPLYIYGGVGLGKTHLMQAIGSSLGSRACRMCYLSTERFMNELINAIRFEKTLEFKDKYRNVDLLLIDDIQFLEGKERTQEEFFHTFNTLYDARRQIVITGDCAPREIPTLQERLRSRFEWGLIADIQPPDLETKVAILRKKSEAHGVTLPDDVGVLVASNTGSNVRELEGALLRLIAEASFSRREIALDMAKETLKDLLGAQAPAVTVENIQKLVANYYDLKVSELKSRNNSPQIAFPRQIAMYLCKRMTPCSLPEIGRRFGGKHHSTVIHAIKKIDTRRVQEKEFDRLLEGFMQSLR